MASAPSSVPHVVLPQQRRLERADVRPPALQLEARDPVGDLQIVAPPVGPFRQPECFDRRDCRRAERRSVRTVAAEQQEPVPGHQVGQPAERQAHGIQIGVDVRVVELDVVDERDVGQILQELRGLVEEGAVVLVALDDELAPVAQPVARPLLTEVQGDAADEHRWIVLRVCEQPAGERGGRRLAVRPGDDNRARAPEELLAYRLRQRAMPDLATEHLLELRVASRDGVADHDQGEVRGDVLGLVADEHGNRFPLEKRVHRRVYTLVRSAHVVPAPLQEGGQRRHGGAAYADEVYVHLSVSVLHEAASDDRRLFDDYARSRARR